MPFSKGTKFGPYEIVSALGAGGMGEVYRARDTRLDRYVAIKTLHSDLSSSPELKSRFEREARILSSLSHPHICCLYDVGSNAGVEFLVMELLEGETLSARLQRGAMSAISVVKLGIEISDALTTAHRHGVIHRDVKPSNIMLSPTGAKLMDFGLAKPIAANRGSESIPLLASLVTATVQSPSTSFSTAGTLIGTIQYMAPEQIEGKEADERSDIFALGTVLYEAVSGHRAFEGKTHLSVASAILQKDPPPIATSNPDVGLPALEYTIRSCIAKESDDRLQVAQDVKLQLAWALHSARLAAPLRRRPFSRLAFGALFTLLLAVVFYLWREFDGRHVSAPAGVTRLTITLPQRQELAVNNGQALVVSPDGKTLAYVAGENGVSHLYTRRLDQFEPVAIPDSEGATFPFFSPNGDWVAFFSQGKLKKAPVRGGSPVVICEVPTFFGGTWTPQDVIVVALPTNGLATVPANGGSLQKVVVRSKENFYPEGPIWFTGGQWIAFTDYLANQRTVMVLKLSTGEVRQVLRNAQAASYVAGHLVYYQGGAVWAVPFDPNNVTVRGSPTQIETGINEENYIAQASTSDTGVLAYAPGPAGSFSRNLYLVDRNGQEHRIDVPPEDFVDPALSPDGKRIACMFRSITGQQLAVVDRDSGIFNTLVSTGLSAAPVWFPDGKALMFDGVSAQQRGIYRIDANGVSAPKLVRTTPLSSHVTSIAAEYAAVTVNDPTTSTDLWLLSIKTPDKMRPFKQTAAAERQGTLSPDGRWMAYVSNESGRPEIYVEAVPGPGGRWQISSSGGDEPRWVRSGQEVIYRNGTKMMSVPVQINPSFHAGRPVALFDGKFDRGFGVAGYDVTADGKTFVMTRSEHSAPTEIRVVMGWLPDNNLQH